MGWQTDLALLQLGGSTVEQHPTYAVVRTPDNPHFHWGNFVLLRRAPLRRDVPLVLSLCDATFPGAQHQAIGVDDPEATPAQLGAFDDLGFRVEHCTVLTTEDIPVPRRMDRAVQVRRLETDADWELRVGLNLAVYDQAASAAHRDFATRRARAERRLVESGHGAWFGAFEGDRLLSCAGIVRATGGLARYQEVETHPGARGRGLAGTLVHCAGQHALEALGATTLIIVADPEHHAVRLYRAMGFRDSEHQVQARRSTV